MKAIWRSVVVTVAVALVSACSNPEADWQQAEAENTEAAYQAFLDQHPDGEWAQRAQAELDAIKDQREWAAAQTLDTIEAYNNYLLAHPTGRHMGEARQRIAELETEASWQAAAAAGTKEALEDFLLRYADAPQAEQARNQLAALSAPAPAPAPKSAPKPATKTAPQKPLALPKGNFMVQLGAFSTLAKAESEKARMEKRHHALLGSLVVQKPSGNDTVYRIRSSAMAESAARSACQRLKAAGQDCVVVRR
ncbi:MAG: SPOR domain-containing protein [Gammaproteobacteria bacterium]|nr:SPOR domain-containing protein [Gammaproteobacteria bacterium]